MRRDADNKWRENRDSLSEDWTNYLSENFIDYKFIPLPNNPKSIIKLVSNIKIDGLILSNGNDWGSCEARDKTELQLINWCREYNLPVLGICRGFQVINKYFGGEIKKDLAKHTNISHAGTIHSVKIINPEKFPNNIQDELIVNSFHNEGIIEEDLANDLIPFAKSNNVVEGFFHKTENILGIQWHPERSKMNLNFNKNLFELLFENKI